MSEDLQRYKNFLVEQTHELKKETDAKQQERLALEESKRSLHECFQNIIYHERITEKPEIDIVPDKETLSMLIRCFHERDVRMRITETLRQVGTARCVVSLRGLQTLGELIKYMLTAIIHEKDVNYRVITAILNVSQLLYFQDDETGASNGKRKKVSRKYYLTQYVNDHGIWQEENIWKSVLSKVLNNKFSEAVQKDKERKSELEDSKRNDDSLTQKATSFMNNFKGIK